MEEKSKSGLKFGAVFVAGALIIVLLVSSINFDNRLSTELYWSSFGTGSSIRGECTFERELLVNQDSMITLSIIAEWSNEGNYTISLEPSEKLIISNNINWTGSLFETIYLYYNLSVEEPGYYEILIKITHELEYEQFSRETVYFEVTDSKMVIDGKPPNTWYLSNYGGGTNPLPTKNENITGELTLSNIPYMNQEVLLTFTFTSSIDILDSSRNQLMLIFPSMGFDIIHVEYPPDGDVWVAGTDQKIQHTWMGEIRKGETYQMTAKFKVIDEGRGNIVCSLVAQTQDGIYTTLQERNSAHLDVNKYTAAYQISEP